MSERCLAVNHGQPGVLLTLFAVRSRRHSYHSQANSAGSIPVTRSKPEKRCSTSESDCISQAGQRSFASENGTRAITRAISHLGECPWRLSDPKLTVWLRFPSPLHRRKRCSRCSGEEFLYCVKAAGSADGRAASRAGMRPPAGPTLRRPRTGADQQTTDRFSSAMRWRSTSRLHRRSRARCPP